MLRRAAKEWCGQKKGPREKRIRRRGRRPVGWRRGVVANFACGLVSIFGGARHRCSSDETRSSPGRGRQPRLRRAIFAALRFAQLALSAAAWTARKAAACSSAAALACLCASFSAAAACSSFFAFARARRCSWRFAVSADRSGRCPAFAAARRCFWRLAVSADRSGRSRR